MRSQHLLYHSHQLVYRAIDTEIFSIWVESQKSTPQLVFYVSLSRNFFRHVSIGMTAFVAFYRDFQRRQVQVDTVISDSKLRFHRKMRKRFTDRSDKFLFFRILNDVDVQVPIRCERLIKFLSRNFLHFDIKISQPLFVMYGCCPSLSRRNDPPNEDPSIMSFNDDLSRDLTCVLIASFVCKYPNALHTSSALNHGFSD